MATVTELERKVAEREARRAELAGRLEEAEAKVRAARTAFVEGAEDRDLMGAQLKRTAVREALEGLDEELDSLRAEHEETAAAAARERGIVRLVELAAEAAEGLESYNAAREEASAILEETAGRLLQDLGRIRECRRQFLQLASELAPGVRSLMYRTSSEDGERRAEVAALEAELGERGADLTVVCDAVFSRTGRESTVLCRHRHGLVADVPLGRLLSDAMDALARQRAREA